MRIRYISPIIPPLVILSAFGLQEILIVIKERFSGRKEKFYATAVMAAVAAGFAWNAVYISEQFTKFRPLDYISGRVGRDAYITRHRPEYPVLQYANQNLGERDKILCLFQGYRRYYIDRVTVHNEKMFGNIVMRASSPDQVAAKLNKRKFTHLLIQFNLFQNWSRSIFTGDEIKRLNTFFDRHTRLLIKKGGYVLLELTPAHQPSG
jgi:hypothetical protein